MTPAASSNAYFRLFVHEFVDDETCRHGAVERKEQSPAHVDLDRDALALRIDVGAECTQVVAQIDLARIAAERELVVRERNRVHPVHCARQLFAGFGILRAAALEREEGYDRLQIVLCPVL